MSCSFLQLGWAAVTSGAPSAAATLLTWAMLPTELGARELVLHFALRSDDGVEVGILGGDIVVRRAGWLARMLRESCPRRLQEVLLVAERRLPMAIATAHYMGDAVRNARPRAGRATGLSHRGLTCSGSSGTPNLRCRASTSRRSS
jgi:hypothetical protein